jgi:hypothetical protein
MLTCGRACGAAWSAPHGVKWPYCWLSYMRETDMDARRLHVIFSQRSTNQRGMWTTTILFTSISLIMIDRCRFPSYVTNCSTWGPGVSTTRKCSWSGDPGRSQYSLSSYLIHNPSATCAELHTDFVRCCECSPVVHVRGLVYISHWLKRCRRCSAPGCGPTAVRARSHDLACQAAA